MTAIYAYAHDQIAFVAGDTLRVDRNGVRRTVCKLHHWSDGVVLAQAGEAQFLSDLLQRVLPLMGFYHATAEGFIEAFRELHREFWSKAEASYKQKTAGPVPEGTVLVAAAATDVSSGRVFKLDFQTGELRISSNHEDADGTDVAQFQADAHRHLESLRTNEKEVLLPLDIWAVRCVEDAATRYPRVIGPPVDVLIARPSTAKDRILVHRRIAIKSAPGLDLFQVP